MIVKFVEMVGHLKFDEKPDYDKFRALLRRGLKEGGFTDNGVLVFPSLSGQRVPSPAKKRALTAPPAEEPENKVSQVKQRAKSSLKKGREPCSPKVTNR